MAKKIDSDKKEIIETTEYVTKTFNGKEVKVKKRLSFEDVTSICSNVVTGSFDEDGEYHPEWFDFLFALYTTIYYSNYFQEYASESTLEEKFNLIYSSDSLYYLVLNCLDDVGRNQLRDLQEATLSKVKHTAAYNLSETKLKLDEIMNSFNDVVTKMGTLFGNVDVTDLQNIVGALASGKPFDENKIVEALLNNKKKK